MGRSIDLTQKSILITGGTGSFGKLITKILVEEHNPRRVIIYSRDELKQSIMAQDPLFAGNRQLRFFIGNVRDKERFARALDGVDIVVHAAAMKQVPVAEYNPFEAVKTNILGAQNLIDCAIDKGVKRIVALSTDKAANPINLYGATKLCSDKLFIAGNNYAGAKKTRFSVVRYGNVIGSRGSVVPLFLDLRKKGVLPLTDTRMTRFWLTLGQGIRFVLDCLGDMRGGELFVPKIPSMKLVDLAKAIAPEAKIKVIGIRPGEKVHEVMLPEDEARKAIELEDRYVLPGKQHLYWKKHGKTCADGFSYSSETNKKWLTIEELRAMIATLDIPGVSEWAQELGIKVPKVQS